MPGKDPGGCLITMLIGVAGAFLDGWIGRSIFNTDLGTFFDLRAGGLAVLGSFILLAGYQLIFGARVRVIH